MTQPPQRNRTRAELYDGFAAVGRALSTGPRLEIIDLLAQSDLFVGQLADEIGQSTANTSRHLQILLQAGLVTQRRQGHHVVYGLSRPEVAQLLSLVRTIAVDEIADVRALSEAHLGDRDDIGWTSERELVHRIRTGDVVVIDVRPPHDYAAGHIVGAMNVQLDAVAALAETLSPDVDVVAYCRGHYCSLADAAVRELQKHGIAARRLEDGYPEWARHRPHEIASQ